MSTVESVCWIAVAMIPAVVLAVSFYKSKYRSVDDIGSVDVGGVKGGRPHNDARGASKGTPEI